MALDIKVKIDTKELERLKKQIEVTKLKVDLPKISSESVFNVNTLKLVDTTIKGISSTFGAMSLVMRAIPSLKDKLGISPSELSAISSAIAGVSGAVKVLNSGLALLGITASGGTVLLAGLVTALGVLSFNLLRAEERTNALKRSIGEKGWFERMSNFIKGLFRDTEEIKIAKFYNSLNFISNSSIKTVAKLLETLKDLRQEKKIIDELAKDTPTKKQASAQQMYANAIANTLKQLKDLGVEEGKILDKSKSSVKSTKPKGLFATEEFIKEYDKVISKSKTFLKETEESTSLADNLKRLDQINVMYSFTKLSIQQISNALSIYEKKLNDLRMEHFEAKSDEIEASLEQDIKVYSNLTDTLTTKLNSLKEFITKFDKKYDNAIVEFIYNKVNNSGNVFDKAIGAVVHNTAQFSLKFDFAIKNWGKEMQGLVDITSKFISGDLSSAFSQIGNVVQSGLSKLSTKLAESGNKIASSMISTGSFIGGAVLSIVTSLITTMTNLAKEEIERRKAIKAIRDQWERDSLRETLEKEIEIRRKHLSALERNLNIYEDAFKRGIIGIDAYNRELGKVIKVKDEVKTKEDKKKQDEVLERLLDKVRQVTREDPYEVLKKLIQLEKGEYTGAFNKKTLEALRRDLAGMGKGFIRELREALDKAKIERPKVFDRAGAPTFNPIFSPTSSPIAPVININVNGTFDLTNPSSIKRFTDIFIRELKVRKIEGGLNV